MNKETRRSGNVRRINRVDISSERRNGKEQREAVKPYHDYISSMKKIPLFQGISDDAYFNLIQMCQIITIQEDQRIINIGEDSNELFILLRGKVQVMSDSTCILTYVEPIQLVGEIGFFTGMRRSATVTASTESTLILIYKHELFSLFDQNGILGNRILLNAISDLADKLLAENKYIEELRKKKRAGSLE